MPDLSGAYCSGIAACCGAEPRKARSDGRRHRPIADCQDAPSSSSSLGCRVGSRICRGVARVRQYSAVVASDSHGGGAGRLGGRGVEWRWRRNSGSRRRPGAAEPGAVTARRPSRGGRQQRRHCAALDRNAAGQSSTTRTSSAGPVERFFLAQGALHPKLAKLVPGQRFILRTPDAEVEVLGTTFRVTIVAPDADCGGGKLTRVSVDDGLVEVRGAGASTYVHPGEKWPAYCAASLPAAVVALQVALPAPSGSKKVARAISSESARLGAIAPG